MGTTNDDLFTRAQAVIPGGVNSPVRAFRSVGGTPYFVAKGLGAHVWDVEGNRYVDWVQSYGASILGHADVDEGADLVMVKPALAYLDVIAAARAEVDLPIAAYHVSGEYSMIKAAAERGWIDGDAVALEHVTAIKRAGADIVLTYLARELAERLSR